MGSRGSSSKIKSTSNSPTLEEVRDEYARLMSPAETLEEDETEFPEPTPADFDDEDYEDFEEFSDPGRFSGEYSGSEGLYDIEDKASENGFSSAEDMISAQIAEISFTTVKQELMDDIEELGYLVVGDNGEYFTIMDNGDGTDSEFAVYYRQTGSTYVLDGDVRKLR